MEAKQNADENKEETCVKDKDHAEWIFLQSLHVRDLHFRIIDANSYFVFNLKLLER
jgi:hypothetical protein